MTFITTAIAFITANWAGIVGVLSGLLGVGVLVAKFTKTPKDDAFFARAMGWLNLIPVGSDGTPQSSQAANSKGPTIAPIMEDK